MKNLFKKLAWLVAFFVLETTGLYADNQTIQLSPVLPANSLPFRITIERANFQLPAGIHSGAVGLYRGLWIFVAGRLNGMHGFGPNPFPRNFQNTYIFVVNPSTGQSVYRSLNDRSAGLSQLQVDSLSVTSPESYQDGDTLYIAGGYGVDTGTGTFGTKPTFTAMYLPGIVNWVTHPENRNYSVIQNIKQIAHPIFQITGGKMAKLGNLTQLIFGQTFTGIYTPGSNGIYSSQVRQFKITNVNGQLAVEVYPSKPLYADPNFRRRDMNIVPVLLNNNNRLDYGFVGYSGVFTPTGGIWTVPVVMNSNSNPVMADPNLPTTFKQAMNNYTCANAGLYSKKYLSMYNIFFGGLSYGFFSGGTFQTDSEIPFINQVTTIQMTNDGQFRQYLMNNQYPVITSTTVNPGNTLLFGAAAYFIPANISHYDNRVLNLDSIRSSTVIGYIVGGIQSTVPNTSTQADSFASPYVFKVTLIPLT